MVVPQLTSRALDLAVGVLVAAGLALEEPVRHGSAVGAAAVAFAVPAGAAVACRRVRPVPAFLATLVLVLGGLHFDRAAHTSLVAVAVVSATVAHQGRRRLSVLVALTLIPCLAVAVLASGSEGEDATTYAGYLLVLLAAVAAGDALRSRGEVTRERRERADAQQQARARELFDGHRLALARDLHDSVAHALVAINTQAGVAVHLHRDDRAGDPLVAVLREVKESSARALAELRETLAALRTDGEPAGTATGLSVADLSLLARPLSVAGVDVNVAVDAELADLPGHLAVVAFRIVQESLTNVLRHADATAVTVDVGVTGASGDDAELTVSVEDNGSGRHAGRPRSWEGHGIRGITERVAMAGGVVAIGPSAAGWRVAARLPL